MWYKKSESIHFDWIMGDLFDVCWDFENALEDWSDDKWKNVFEQEIAKRGYTDEISDVVRKELVRFFSWRDGR